MKIGVPKEVKESEYRVSLTPACVEELTERGHGVFVEKGAGLGSGIPDDEYIQAGAEMLNSAEEVFNYGEMIVKVKEPQPSEFPLMREGQILFTYLHLAAVKELTIELCKRKVKAVAYETVRTPDGRHPLLTPMSEVAGRMSIQEGAKYLECPSGGRGVLLGGIPGSPAGEVVIIGGGVVGTNAAKMAAGTGANVTILEVNLDRMRYLDDVMPPNVKTVMSNARQIRDSAAKADLLVGAVLVEGARAPVLVPRDVLSGMKTGAVIVDVSIDQGGCIETSRPTTHRDPTYIVDGVVHYCVANIPGAVARTSTFGLTNATLPYVVKMADKGMEEAASEDESLRRGVNVYDGHIANKAVADTFGLEYREFK